MEKFIISKKNREFRFDFLNNNGQILLKSGSYTRKTMCINGIESIKRNSQDNSKFKCKRTLNNEFYFNLKSFNGKIIGTSILFKDCKSSAKSVLI
nr:YegP family protein [uncultured Flavobacterium sp.]